MNCGFDILILVIVTALWLGFRTEIVCVDSLPSPTRPKLTLPGLSCRELGWMVLPLGALTRPVHPLKNTSSVKSAAPKGGISPRFEAAVRIRSSPCRTSPPPATLMPSSSMAFITRAKNRGFVTMVHTGEMNNFGTVVPLSENHSLTCPPGHWALIT
jgi:hypothetical protein